MQINEKRIRIAGIKDAKAHTIQYMTLENIPPSLIKKVKIRDVKITLLGHIEEPVNSAYLLGNRFRIAIHGVRDTKNVVETRVCRIQDEVNSGEGIANFYGYQRFGTIRPITHLVGRCLVKREFGKAVLTYLTATGEKEEPVIRRLREELKETRDYRQFLREVPKKFLYERLLVEHLIKKPGDYIGAIRSLPFPIRRLLLNAYQSYLFNLSLSRRVKQGQKLNYAYRGDWLMKKKGDGLYFTERTREDKDLSEEQLKKMRRIVGIAVPGYRTELLEGPQDQIMKDILMEEGVSLRSFYIGPIPEISSEGKIRPAPLMVSNFVSDVHSENEEIIVDLSFTLEKECYATILLREFMKPQDIVEAGF